MYDIYNSEPYILDETCGDVYRVYINNQELVKYINDADVFKLDVPTLVKTSTTY
jgi:hypothetical protein